MDQIDTSPFRDNGYQVFRGLLPAASLAELKRFLEGKVDAQLMAACEELGCASPERFLALAGQAYLEGGAACDRLSKAALDTLTGHFSLATRLSQELWAVPRQPRFQALLEALLGSGRIGMHMPPAARFILPGNAFAGVPPHQDLSYNRHLSAFLTIWVPLVAIDDACGGVGIFHGSGAAPELPVQATPGGVWLEGLATGGYCEEHPWMEPGDVLVLNPFVIHGSRPNRSDRPRFSIDYRFFGAEASSTKHYLDLRTWKVQAPQEGGVDEYL